MNQLAAPTAGPSSPLGILTTRHARRRRDRTRAVGVSPKRRECSHGSFLFCLRERLERFLCARSRACGDAPASTSECSRDTVQFCRRASIMSPRHQSSRQYTHVPNSLPATTMRTRHPPNRGIMSPKTCVRDIISRQNERPNLVPSPFSASASDTTMPTARLRHVMNEARLTWLVVDTASYVNGSWTATGTGGGIPAAPHGDVRRRRPAGCHARCSTRGSPRRRRAQ
jgi:hypothetical protein